MRFVLFLTIICLSAYASAQSGTTLNPGASSFYDTIKARSENYYILHYHEVSYEQKKKMLSSNDEDIFKDSINQSSRMIIFKPSSQEINLPTIPLDNIVILEDKGIIIGLTRIQASPYLIVIYNLDGKLLYKGNLGTSVLKLKKTRLKQLITKYPSLLSYIKKNNCFKDADTCLIELSRGMLNTIGRDSARNEFKDELILGYYIPYQFVSDGDGIYSRYRGFYRYSDPYYDLVMIGSTPYLLVLNTENGKQVSIPLISNCD